MKPLYMSSPSGGEKRRRVRKDAGGSSTPEEPVVELPTPLVAPTPVVVPVVANAPELKPREDATVEFKIQDVRDVLSGKTAVEKEVEEDEEDDDEEWEYVDVDEEEDNDEYEYVIEDYSGKIEDYSGKKLDSLEQLLADARSFRVDEDKKDAEEEGDEEGSGKQIIETISGVISTIVTIDFFVVIALLLWFLAGIFGQYALKDETIQIAFNNIFESVVQPALAVLMLGSAAGAAFRKDEEEF